MNKVKVLKAMKMVVSIVEKNKFESAFTRIECNIMRALYKKVQGAMTYATRIEEMQKEFPYIEEQYFMRGSDNTIDKNMNKYHLYNYSMMMLKKNKEDILKEIETL
jgi:hypothetical protein